MAISINTGFQLLNAYEAIDSRCYYTSLVDMANATIGIYEGCLCYLNEDSDFKGYYSYSKNNTLDTDLGYWRPFKTGDGDVIDDSLEKSLVKTYSITKIKELLNKNGGYVLVDTLPDLTDPVVIDTLELTKIYLVPADNSEDKNEKTEYICVHIGEVPATYQVPLVTEQTDYDTFKTEIEDYVTNQGGTNTDDFVTYSAVVTTTTMTEDIYLEMQDSIYISLDSDYDTYKTRIEAIELTPAQPESYTWEILGTLGGDAGLVVEDDVIVTNPVGKIKENENIKDKTVLDLVLKMLQKDIPTTLKLVGNPTDDSLFEKYKDSIIDCILNLTITLGTGAITDGTEIIISKDGVELTRIPYVDGTLTYTYTDTGANIKDTTKYEAIVSYNIDGISDTAKDNLNYEFALPMYYGTTQDNVVIDVDSLTKVVEKVGKKTWSFSVVNGYCCFMIPSTVTVKSIYDSNNFNNTSSFSESLITLNLNGNDVEYKVYTNNNPVTCTNFQYIVTIA